MLKCLQRGCVLKGIGSGAQTQESLPQNSSAIRKDSLSRIIMPEGCDWSLDQPVDGIKVNVVDEQTGSPEHKAIQDANMEYREPRDKQNQIDPKTQEGEIAG